MKTPEQKAKDQLKKEKQKFRESVRKDKAKIKRENKSLPKKADDLWSKAVRKV
jgi:hypothetical protein